MVIDFNETLKKLEDEYWSGAPVGDKFIKYLKTISEPHAEMIEVYFCPLVINQNGLEIDNYDFLKEDILGNVELFAGFTDVDDAISSLICANIPEEHCYVFACTPLKLSKLRYHDETLFLAEDIPDIVVSKVIFNGDGRRI